VKKLKGLNVFFLHAFLPGFNLPALVLGVYSSALACDLHSLIIPLHQHLVN
jgi:hypothetical protein